MNDKFQYKLSKNEKVEIAQNLINILQKDSDIANQTRTFISNWILTVADEKGKDFFDVWDIVLKNYLPTKRPVLFRSCMRVAKTNEISSFTGRLECAKRFSEGKGVLIICDTKESLAFEEKVFERGNYRHTFYPLVSVLKKARKSGGKGFSESLLDRYIGEDEYIMRIDLDNMDCLSWL